MNRLLTVLRGCGTAPAPDRNLIDRFLRERDEAAFTELVRRYGPVVWGVCRRVLTNTQDAEDAFQATFLVLLRRAAKLDRDTPLGPWLYRVAVLTARNVVRANRRRAAVNGPMEHELPARAGPDLERLDLDAALFALSERERAAVVLCHLQGFTRREAAEQLGCPEGTLSARLDRALSRLRTRLGACTLAALGAGLPTGLAQATTHSASLFAISQLAAPGLSPTVAQLADGVLRMFWMKKMMAATAVLVLVAGAGVFTFGTAGRTSNTARATEPPAASGAPPVPAESGPIKKIEKQLADLEKQKRAIEAAFEDLKAEKTKLEEANAALELGKDIEVLVSDKDSAHPLVVREVVNGRAAEVTCRDLDSLTTYLRRAYADPQGPKGLRIIAYKEHAAEELRKVLTACAVSGFAKASFGQVERPSFMMSAKSIVEMANKSYGVSETRLAPRAKLGQKPDELDLTKYAVPKKQP